jgi:hypothetical protein
MKCEITIDIHGIATIRNFKAKDIKILMKNKHYIFSKAKLIKSLNDIRNRY